jgi:competence protein ComEC
MTFPFLFLASSLASGIFISSLFPSPLYIWIIALLFFLISSWISFSVLKKTQASFICILLTTFFLGSALYTYHNNMYEKNSLHTFSSEDYLEFYGHLFKSPSRGQKKDYLYLKIEKIIDQEKEIKTQGRLRVTVPHSEVSPLSSDLYNLDKVRISARLSPSERYRNFNVPPMEMYLKNLKIHKAAYTKSPLLVNKLSSGKKHSPFRIISILRRKLQSGIERHFSNTQNQILSPQGAVVEALLLGERGRMNPEYSQSLQHAGIYHLFAISGAHIAIISFLIFSFFKLLRFPNRLNYSCLILFLIFFAFLVEGRPSVLRATIMATAFLVGKLIWRNVDLLNTLSISAFILLFLNPFNLFSIGFQLTFSATLSIILFFPKIVKFLPRLPLRISEVFTLSLTAQLGVLPLIALAFNRVTFSSLLLNFAAIPLVGLIMAFGYIFLVFSLTFSFIADILSRLIHILVDILMAISNIFDPFPALSYRIPSPSLLVLLGYYLFLAFFLVQTKIRNQKLIALSVFALFFAMLVTYPFPSHSRTLKLTFIDVGQGDSILVEFPGSKKMLVDGGGMPEETFDIGERVVSPFLWRKGIKKIDYLVLTHAHPDHMNGLKAVARNFKIKEFWEAFSPQENESYTEFKRSISRKTICRRTFRGQERKFDGVKIEVLNPTQADPFVFRIHNDHSLVLRVVYGQTSFLLTGDIGIPIENELERVSQTLESQVLKSPHHGSDSSSSEDFLKAVAPQIVVISVGKGNIYNLPDQDILDRYEQNEARIYRTDQVGAVEISSDGKELFIRTAAESR